MGGLKTKVYDSYQDLLDDTEIDCVYIPLPNGMHHEWALKALASGKHVLVEKPAASNAEEVRSMIYAAREKNLVLMEGFAWMYHPYRKRFEEILQSGAIGEIHEINSTNLRAGPMMNVTAKDNFRFNYSLAGGVLMDVGTYALKAVEVVMGSEVPVVDMATAEVSPFDPEIDFRMEGRITFPKSGVIGHFAASYWGSTLDISIVVKGSKGIMHLNNYEGPDKGNEIRVTDLNGKLLFTESVPGGDSRFEWQLRAFCNHVGQVRSGKAQDVTHFENTGEEVVLHAQLLDQVYRAAGMKPRRMFNH